MGFQVTYIDNFSAPGEGASWAGGSFASYEEAVAHCKGVVDSFLEQEHKPGMRSEELWDRYAMFGEDATVRSGTGDQFSGWDYARHRCQVLCGGREAA
ncbi:hypothetical protein GCM10027034_42700 [Ramlibacter solisilvae]|nr:hypothetical protein [Ramlibacter tataouinensis]